MARCVGILFLICLLPVVALAQSGNETSVVRTPWGAPDLRGVWDYRTMTPLERSANFAAREFLSDEEAATYERQVLERRGSRPLAPGSTHAQWWLDQGTALTDDHRTSLIVDPPDGRIPPLTPEAQAWNAAQGGQRPVRARQVVNSSLHGPEDLGLAERCLLGYSTGPPVVPNAYNNNIQLFQTPDHVAILIEMVHDVRIVQLDGRAHLPSDIRQWLGDARGHWEGDTLVVHTTNFTDKTGSFDANLREPYGSGKTLHLIERFTRTGEHALLYEFTIDDPTTFTRPFTAVVPMRTSDGSIYEYACHEGNYAMVNGLTSARNRERARATSESAGR